MSAEQEPLLQDVADGFHGDRSQGSIPPSPRTLCVVAGLYTRRVYEEKPKNPPSVPAPPGSNDTTPICITPECVLTAAQILKDVDLTVNPCDDFYQYTCSNWEKNHEIPDGKSSINSFVSLVNQNKEALRTIFSGSFDDFYDRTHASFRTQLPDPEKLIDKQNFEKVKSLYDSCMNEALIDERGTEPIYPLLKEIHDMFPASKNSPDSRRLTQTLSFLAKRSIGALFEIIVDADPKDPSVNSLQLYQSGLTLPNKVYYTQEETVEALYETIVDTLAVIYRSESDLASELFAEYDANATARSIVNFEKKLANISQLPEEFQDPEATYNLLSLSELAKINSNVDWGLYINHLLPPNAPHPGKIVVTSPAFIGNVSTQLLEKETSRTLQAYFTWKVIFAYADALSDDIRTPIRRLTSKLIGTNPKSIKPRWDTCLDEVNGAVGFLAGRYYVLDKFGGDAKERADDFVNSIKEVFLKRLPELEWIDSATREKAVEKVEKLIRKVGYPDASPDIMSPVSLSGYYGELSLADDDYFGNYVNARKFGILDEWRQVGKTPDRSKWLMNPQEVNAYYNPSFNEIVFPAGILQAPFFASDYPDYLNYGGIGVVVGHELTHGFDNMGRHFDAEGRLVQWWTNETSAQFDKKADCFVKQYSNFTMIDDHGEVIHVNGKFTLGENLADNGGLGESYIAWKQRYDSDKKSKRYNNVRLPGLDGLSPEQLFFVNFGRIWCNKVTPAQAKKGVLTDEHSPAKWRVNGAVQNSNHFADVFNCPSGSPMNPVAKCELW
ncbi:hypothetical protein [Parasitella parasitica]|uniref:Peptidase M13 C-terminal domain-containing protein n=1 Tax=Parasitella parasitica TaxID=35722 RepID=A0A0B7NXH2_9FUNG|nr:hypothetical protein [Parasitella parasitica]